MIRPNGTNTAEGNPFQTSVAALVRKGYAEAAMPVDALRVKKLPKTLVFAVRSDFGPIPAGTSARRETD